MENFTVGILLSALVAGIGATVLLSPRWRQSLPALRNALILAASGAALVLLTSIYNGETYIAQFSAPARRSASERLGPPGEVQARLESVRPRVGGGRADPEAAGPDRFQWPPPAASSWVVIPMKQLLAQAGLPARGPARQNHDLADAAAGLATSLVKAGFSGNSFYPVPRGFALASAIEQTEPDGTPKPAALRWRADIVGNGGFTLAALLERLFKAPAGYYRIIVFVVSPEPIRQSATRPAKEDAQMWVHRGWNILDPRIGAMPLTGDYACTALVYEFEKTDVDTRVLVRQPGRLSARAHLVKAGLNMFAP